MAPGHERSAAALVSPAAAWPRRSEVGPAVLSRTWATCPGKPLTAGDTVLIYYRANAPAKEQFVLAAGTPSAPVTVGVLGPNGEPDPDGATAATTRARFNYPSAAWWAIKIGKPVVPADERR